MMAGFKIKLEPEGVTVGSTTVLYEFKAAPEVVLDRIKRYEANLQALLLSVDITIKAPIPGRETIGIYVPREDREVVDLKRLMEHPSFEHSVAAVPLIIGVGEDGAPTVCDLAQMPHLLVSGSTGSGKSVFLHSLILSTMCKKTPKELRFFMFDPKFVELSRYKKMCPHLVKMAATEREMMDALYFLIGLMEVRYEMMATVGVRSCEEFDQGHGAAEQIYVDDQGRFSRIVVVIEELADLLLMCPKAERLILKLLQMARAAGIHLILSTQRPSADIINSGIKANVPARVAFKVASQTDSRVILDQGGAEKLLGRGDMLFHAPGTNLKRLQGAYVEV